MIKSLLEFIFPNKAKYEKSLLIVLCFFPFFLEGGNVHLESTDPHSHLTARYYFVDLGETDLDLSVLSRLSPKCTLGPAINNQSQIITNHSAGGSITIGRGLKFSPQPSGLSMHFHCINSQNDLLISISRGHDSLEWQVWPWVDNCLSKERLHVYTVDPFIADFVPTGFNDEGKVIGYRFIDHKKRPVIWRKETRLKSLGEKEGLHLDGIPMSINQSGSVVGFVEEATDRYPFFWTELRGLDSLKNYRYLEPRGWLEFKDLVLTSDDVVYGTFWMKHLMKDAKGGLEDPFFAFCWEPKKGNLQKLNLGGMRIADVNQSHLLVGSQHGYAVICEKRDLVTPLSALIDPKQLQGWDLIEASSINDQGQIVGFGLYKGKTHLFLAEPVRNL